MDHIHKKISEGGIVNSTIVRIRDDRAECVL